MSLEGGSENLDAGRSNRANAQIYLHCLGSGHSRFSIRKIRAIRGQKNRGIMVNEKDACVDFAYFGLLH